MKRTEMPKLEDVSEMLSSSDMVGVEKGSLEHSIGLILIFSCFVGENAEQLHMQTGIPLPVIYVISEILKKNGVFGKKIDRFHEYFRDEHSGISLNLDIACGQDLLKRSIKNGEPAFMMTELGCEYVEGMMANHPEAKEFMDQVIESKKKASEAYRKNQARNKR